VLAQALDPPTRLPDLSNLCSLTRATFRAIAQHGTRRESIMAQFADLPPEMVSNVLAFVSHGDGDIDIGL
jgi:hypothetical protein